MTTLNCVKIARFRPCKQKKANFFTAYLNFGNYWHKQPVNRRFDRVHRFLEFVNIFCLNFQVHKLSNIISTCFFFAHASSTMSSIFSHFVSYPYHQLNIYFPYLFYSNAEKMFGKQVGTRPAYTRRLSFIPYTNQLHRRPWTPWKIQNKKVKPCVWSCSQQPKTRTRVIWVS